MHQFDEETQVTQSAAGRWTGRLNPHWNIGENPNGGYMVAVALRALQGSLPHADPLSVTTHFLRPGSPAEACEVVVDVIRTGRTLSTARASLRQAGSVRLEVLAAFGDLEQPAGVEQTLSIDAPTLPPPDACVLRSGETQGVQLPILDRLEVRLHPQLAEPGRAGRAEMAGWIRFVDGRAPDPNAMVLFADAFPPSPFGVLGRVGWVPTLELTVHVRRKPAPGWIMSRFETQDLHNGRMVESGALWDSTGNLVAQSRQLGLVLERQ